MSSRVETSTPTVLDQIKLMRNNFARTVLNSNNDSEMKSRIREFDWKNTAVGALEDAPISLLTTIATMLSSSFPMTLFWGKSLTVFYNDAYIPVCGAKHPSNLGKIATEAWHEIWEDVLRPMIMQALEQGKTVYQQDALLFLTRYGYIEETYLTYSFGPIYNDDGVIEGVFSPVVETTKKVIAERRLNLLKEVAAQTSKTMTLDEACNIIATVFCKLSIDIPFSLIYLKDEASSHLVLKATSGFSDNTLPEKIPTEVDLGKSYAESSIQHILTATAECSEITIIENPSDVLGSLPKNDWNEIPTRAVVIRFNAQNQKSAAGILIIGVNTRKKFDEDYETFVELLANQISKAISTAQSYEQERKRAEELAKIDQAKTLFFTNISHEFRTPLSLIISGLEQLKPELHTSTQKETISIVRRNAKRLLKLVNTLLDFSRIEAGRVDICFQPTKIVEFTKSLVNLFEPIIIKEGLDFEFESDISEETIYVDRSMFEKIVLNLISNAFKYTLHGKVGVYIKKTKNESVDITVKDSGVGIAEEEIQNLFKRFYRIPGSKGRSFEGSGIGLALVQELIKYHNGSIKVESTYGKGSSFTVSFKLGKAHLPKEKIKDDGEDKLVESKDLFLEEANQWVIENMSQTPEVQKESNSLNPSEKEMLIQSPNYKSRILVVDDNGDMRKYLKNILSPFFQVETCCDGQEAYNYAAKNIPDLIVSDVMMPNVDGFQLIKLIRANPETNFIPIILLSARAGEEAKIEGLKKGANDYLVKTSFASKELIMRVVTHLELNRLRLDLKKEVEAKDKALSKLEEIRRTQEEFIDTVCHEIRNPLSGILGNSEILMDILNTGRRFIASGKSGELAQFVASNVGLIASSIKSIQECVSHQTMIANDVLSLSKLESGKTDIDNAPTNLSQEAHSCIELFTSQITDKKLKVIPNSLQGLVVEIDSRKYKQILINFLSNAIKFSSDGGKIWIDIKYIENGNKKGISTSVKDEGCGISEDDQKLLFQRFSQVNQSVGKKYGGFGLGLAICSKLVRLLGGDIQVQSEKSKGTTFSFFIPCAKVEQIAQPLHDESPTVLAPPPNKLKPILIVEDNEINQKILKRILTTKGFVCEVASNGKEAVSLFEPSKYNLIFMDVIMPEMNGLEATKCIREKEIGTSERVPIIGLSGNARQEHQAQAMEAGMDDYIIKPVLSQTVFRIINNWSNK